MAKNQLPPGFLEPQNLELGIALCTRNARELQRAAETLYGHGQYGPAAALSTLAVEEYAKKIVLTAVRMGHKPAEKELAKMLFGGHEVKLAIAWHSFAQLTPILPPAERTKLQKRLPQLTELLHQAKMRGLYVDYFKGAWHAPQEIEIKELAERTIAATREMQGSIEPVLEQLLKQAKG